MKKTLCPICVGAKTLMTQIENRLHYIICKTCKGEGEVDDTMFEHYEDDELL